MILPEISPFQWAYVGDLKGPSIIHNVSTNSAQREGPKSATVLECEFSFLSGTTLLFSLTQQVLRLKQPVSESIRFQHPVRSRQWKTRISKKPGAFLQQQQSPDAARSETMFQVQLTSKASFNPFNLVGLRVLNRHLKNRHIRMENHQPLWVRHLILQKLTST